MILKKLLEFLDSNKVKYIAITHSKVYTAEEIALAAHLPGRVLAKTVMVKINGKIVMTVVPASEMVSFKMLKKCMGADTVELAKENEFKDIFPDCELGAMPPFGNFYNVEVYVTESLTEDEEIAFNAGSHLELIRMAYKDFEKLVKPKIMRFSIKKKSPNDDHWSVEL
jgi:Ala-tRNA(Pro) deacylase